MLRSELLQTGISQLSEAGIVSASAEARTLLCQVLEVENLVLASPEVEPAAVEQYYELLQERKAGVAVQLLTGKMYFRHLELRATPGVFMVRPETEILVDLALTRAQEIAGLRSRPVRILDLCCGSGAIAVSLFTELKDMGIKTQVSAIDISPAALEVTAYHAEKYASPLQIRQHNLEDWKQWWQGDKWDLIVSNPPYIPQSVQLPADVTANDPQEALYGGGEDGMRIPQAVIEFAYHALVPDGALVMEHDDTQGYATCQAGLAVGFQECQTILDLNQRSRFLLARRVIS